MEGLPRHTPTVGLGELVERVVGGAYADLQALASALPGQPEPDRKRELARYLHNLRQRLVRLAVVAEWAPVQRRAQISILCGDMLGQLRQHDRAFVSGADRLFALHSQMLWSCAPLFDLPGALDVLCNGAYSALPRTIADVAPEPAPSEDELETPARAIERRDLERRIEREMRGRLLESAAAGKTPDAMLVWGVRDGVAVVGVPGEYRATLTLGGPPPLPPPPVPSSANGGDEEEDPSDKKAPSGEARDAVVPAPPHGGWLVKTIEILAGERLASATPSASGGEEVRPFVLSKLEDRVLGERATARMAGMSPPPPAPPELIVGGAQGLAGLHYVCHDAALRLAAATIMGQSKRVARGGGAWHGGAIRVEPIKAAEKAEKAEKAAGEEERAAETDRVPDGGGVGEEEKRGDASSRGRGPSSGAGEGVRMWFWLPGQGRRERSRLAGVDVGSVDLAGGPTEAAAAAATADAFGALPRVDLTYARAVESDPTSGRIRAAAIVPRGPKADSSKADSSGDSVEEELPFDMRAVDIREVLADGIRVATRLALERLLPDIRAAFEPAGASVTLDLEATAAPSVGIDAFAGDGGGDGEDGWGGARRPAVRVRLSDRGATAEITCDKRGGHLALVGAGRLTSPAAAAFERAAIRDGGVAGMPAVAARLARAALESDLRAAIRARAGFRPMPAPRVARRADGVAPWPMGGAPPAAMVPVPPAAGGLFVAVFVEGSPGPGAAIATPSPGRSAKKSSKGQSGGGAAKKKKDATPAAAPLRASLALLRNRASAHWALTPEIVAWAALGSDGRALGKRRSGGVGSEAGSIDFAYDADAAADRVCDAATNARVAAQRLAVTDALASESVAFEDVRAVGPDEGARLDVLPRPTVSFRANIVAGGSSEGSDAAALDEGATAVAEVAFGGAEGVVATVRSPWYPSSNPPARGGEGAAASARGAKREITRGDDGTQGCVVTLTYGGGEGEGEGEGDANATRNASAFDDPAPLAALADVKRVAASLAFLRAIEADAGVARDVRVVAVEALSALVAVGKTTARVGWGVGRGGGASGGMGCAFAEGSREDDGARAEAEDEASEAARVGDVEAFRDALMKAGAGA